MSPTNCPEIWLHRWLSVNVNHDVLLVTSFIFIQKLKKKQEEAAIQIEMAKIRKEMIAQRNLEEKRRQEYELGKLA